MRHADNTCSAILQAGICEPTLLLLALADAQVLSLR